MLVVQSQGEGNVSQGSGRCHRELGEVINVPTITGDTFTSYNPDSLTHMDIHCSS